MPINGQHGGKIPSPDDGVHAPGMLTHFLPVAGRRSYVASFLRHSLLTSFLPFLTAGYYVEYRTQNGDLVCQPVRKETVRSRESRPPPRVLLRVARC
jgi:hypothetical protein